MIARFKMNMYVKIQSRKLRDGVFSFAAQIIGGVIINAEENKNDKFGGRITRPI